MEVEERLMEQYLDKSEFDEAAEGLPHLLHPDLEAEVVYIEAVDAAYFSNNRHQRCIVRRSDGKLYLSRYD
jgi:hypothetical protein